MAKPDYTSLDLPPPPPGRPYVVMNMVMSVDGKVVVEGTEQGIGSKIDQRLMRELRVNADVVLNGANTLRASGTSSRLGDEILEQIRTSRGKPRYPVAAVVSASGDLPLDKIFFTARDFPAVIYLSKKAPAARRKARVCILLLPMGPSAIGLGSCRTLPAAARARKNFQALRMRPALGVGARSAARAAPKKVSARAIIRSPGRPSRRVA